MTDAEKQAAVELAGLLETTTSAAIASAVQIALDKVRRDKARAVLLEGMTNAAKVTAKAVEEWRKSRKDGQPRGVGFYLAELLQDTTRNSWLPEGGEGDLFLVQLPSELTRALQFPRGRAELPTRIYDAALEQYVDEDLSRLLAIGQPLPDVVPEVDAVVFVLHTSAEQRAEGVVATQASYYVYGDRIREVFNTDTTAIDGREQRI